MLQLVIFTLTGSVSSYHGELQPGEGLGCLSHLLSGPDIKMIKHPFPPCTYTYSHHLISYKYHLCLQNAVAVSIENWTNQKLEFPSLTQEEGGTDRWYPPQDIPKHTRLVLIPICWS